MRPRLLDVAEAASVSIATASRALAGTNGVSPAVAERVRATARELGYVTNMHARSLAGGSSDSIGLLVHEIGDPYFSEIASGVLGVATERGLTVQICHTGRDPDTELTQVRALVANRVGAILVAGSGFVDPEIETPARLEFESYAASGGRVAVIGRHHLRADAVLPDNVDGGRQIAEHVLDLGHRRVAVVAGSRALTTVADRLAGIHLACDAAGVPREDIPVLEEAFARDGGRTGMRRILEDHPDTTAVIALNDDMAIGVLAEARRARVSVPGEMSVTGFDDVAVAEDLAPALTTIRLPMAEMGAKALGLALKEPGRRTRRAKMPATLVVRESTAQASG
ncbi:LacI family DNA-binding transcriptional regulator [Nocardioides hungaricus]